MIKYEGIHKTTNPTTSIIRFSNELGKFVDIPIEKSTAERIAMHLQLIAITQSKTVERGNDEASE